MRILLALASLLALAAFAPCAAAADCPPACIGAGVQVTYPTDACGDCVGVAVQADLLEPAGCSDCGGVVGAASVEHAGGSTTVSALVCRGGFVVVCPVDQSITV